MKNIFSILIALLACGTCLSALADVTASLDRNHIAQGETVRLVVQSDSNPDGQPDIGPLTNDFDVLGSSLGTSMQIINGRSSSQTQVSYILAPKHGGRIRIPPLQWGAEQSPELELTVSGDAGGRDAAAPAGSSDVLLTATPEQRQIYVQQPVVLKVRIYVGTQINQATLDLQGNSDVLVKQIGKDRQTSDLRNGRSYQVVERKYLLIPQRSGRITLKGPVLDGQVQSMRGGALPDFDAFLNNFFSQMQINGQVATARPLHLSANPVELNVLPRPAAATGANWLPAQKVMLEESWRPDNGDAVHVGDPVTRHLHLTAVGVTGAQLPDLSTLMPVPDGVKMYPDQAKTNDSMLDDTVVGSRDQDVAFIASKPGHYVLPAVRLAWWDTVSKVQREADLPERTLDILPATGKHAAAVPPPPPTANQPSTTTHNTQAEPLPQPSKAAGVPPWEWISAVLALIWLGTVVAWWVSRRRATEASVVVTPETMAPSMEAVDKAAIKAADKPPAESIAKPVPEKRHAGGTLSTLQQACRDNDAHAARRYLLDWAAEFWPDAPPSGIKAVAARLADPRYVEPLQQLDRACYTGSAWQGESLAQAFATAPKKSSSEKAKPVIPDLYA